METHHNAAPTAEILTSNQWDNDHTVIARLDAAKTEYRRLAKQGDFAGAAAAVRAGIHTSTDTCRSRSLDESRLQSRHAHRDRDAECADCEIVDWTPWRVCSADVKSAVHRLGIMLGKAQYLSGDLKGSLATTQYLDSESDCIESVRKQALFMTVRTCINISPVTDESLQIGVNACHKLKTLVPSGSYELADILELESQLAMLECGESGTTPTETRRRALLDAVQLLEEAIAEGESARKTLEARSITTQRGLKNKRASVHSSNKRQRQLDRERILRSYKAELGMVDIASEATNAAQEVARKEERRKRDQRKRAKRAHCLDEKLAQLQPHMEKLQEMFFNQHVCSPAVDSTGRALSRLPWIDLPEALQPSSINEGGIRRRGTVVETAVSSSDRILRKKWQLESIFSVLQSVLQSIESSRPADTDSVHIVDFGSGSGNSALVFAALLPSCRFTLVDVKESCVSIGRQRTEAAGLSNVKWWQGDLVDFNLPFDVALATHLCGEATDVAQELAMKHRAAYILTPCCLGKIKTLLKMQLDRDALLSTDQGHQNKHESASKEASLPRYPRSNWLGNYMTAESYTHLVRLADYNRECSQKQPLVASKQLIDLDRAMAGTEAGYSSTIGKLSPEEASVKNDILIGIPPSSKAD